MKLLDLFAGEGGATVGYQRAGWDVTAAHGRHHPRGRGRMSPTQKVALIRSITGHANDPERALDDIAAVLDGASLEELVARRLKEVAR